MTGTKAGGKKAAETNKERNGKDFYKKIGQKGGSAFREAPRWFALHPELARKAGAKGGSNSTRAGIKNGEGKKWRVRNV